MSTLAGLKQYNRWRRGMEYDGWTPHPREIGKLLDAACEELETLRKFHQLFDGSVEELSRHFGAPAAALYNEAYAIRDRLA